jgi:hypothetical protein
MLHKLHKLNNQKSDFESLNGPKTSKNVKPELLPDKLLFKILAGLGFM